MQTIHASSILLHLPNLLRGPHENSYLHLGNDFFLLAFHCQKENLTFAVETIPYRPQRILEEVKKMNATSTVDCVTFLWTRYSASAMGVAK